MPNESKEIVTDDGALLVRNFSGMDNVTAEDRLTLDELRDAVNVDISKEGRVTRRSGRRRILSNELIRGLWSPDGVRIFYAALNKLRMLDTSTEVDTELFTDVSLSGTPAFVELNGDIYWTDGVGNWIIRPDLSVVPWGVRAPVAQVVATGMAGGTLEAGDYLVSATCYTNTGEESGSLPIQTVTVPANGKIQFAGLLAPNDSRIVGYRLYLGTIGGKVLYHAADVARINMSAELTTVQNQGAELRTQEMVPMTPGKRLAHYRGRIYAMSDRVLTWTEPLRYGLTKPSTNYYVMPSDGTILAAYDEGLFVITGSKTYRLGGRDPDGFELLELLDYGAPPGNAENIPGSAFGLESDAAVSVWMSNKGLVMGLRSGSVANLTQKRVAMAPCLSASVAYREEGGRRQVVASNLKSGKTNRMGVGAVAYAEVRRNGVVVG